MLHNVKCMANGSYLARNDKQVPTIQCSGKLCKSVYEMTRIRVAICAWERIIMGLFGLLKVMKSLQYVTSLSLFRQ